MKKSVRRVIFYIFLGAFCVLAPFTVLYTAGYRFSLQSGIDLDVGSLSITTIPRRAELRLNQIDSFKWAPHVFQELQPGRHSLSISRSGFHSWQSTVEIIPGLTTYVQHITLFRNSQPEPVFTLYSDGPVAFYERYAAYAEGHSESTYLTVVNLANGSEIYSVALHASPISLEWSLAGDYILVRFADYYSVFSANGDLVLDTRSHFSGDIISFEWDTSRENVVLAELDRQNSRYAAIDLPSLQETYLDFQIISLGSDGSVLALKNLFTSSVLVRIQGEQETDVAVLPRSQYALNSRSSDYIVLSDLQESLYLVSLADGSVLSIDSSSSLTAWNKERDQVAYTDGIELNVLTPKQSQRDLLLRFESPVTHLDWHAGGQRILFTQNGALQAIDTYLYGRSRDHISLTSDEYFVEDFSLGRRGRFAYLLTSREEADGRELLRLRLR